MYAHGGRALSPAGGEYAARGRVGRGVCVCLLQGGASCGMPAAGSSRVGAGRKRCLDYKMNEADAVSGPNGVVDCRELSSNEVV